MSYTAFSNSFFVFVVANDAIINVISSFENTSFRHTNIFNFHSPGTYISAIYSQESSQN